MLRSVFAILMMLAGLFLLGACGEEQGSSRGGGNAKDSGEKQKPRQTVGNMPISGGIGDAVDTDTFEVRVLDLFETDNYYYLENPSVPLEQDVFSQAGRFVIVNYSVRNTGGAPIEPNLGGALQVKADGNIETYEESDQASHPASGAATLQLAPREVKTGQFIFDVPTDVKPDVLTVRLLDELEEPLGQDYVVDLTRENPQGAGPEEVLALQYEYGNMQAWEQAYALFDQESKGRVSEEEYASSWEGDPASITQYAFPSVEVQGDRATIERVFTSAGPDGEQQDQATQEAVLEEEGWRIVMRDEQIEFFSGGGESTSSSGSASASGSASPEQADIECSIGQECDLGGSTITITSAEQAESINTSSGEAFEGNFVIVEFDYTYGGDSPADTGEPPFQLSDDEGNSYSLNFDATSSYGIDNDRSLIYTTVQPGVTAPGTAIFEVSSEAEDFNLLVVDLIAPQSGDSASVELSGGSASASDGGSEADVVGATEAYYEAVDTEDWTYTYDSLDSETQDLFTEEEWSQKNQWFADNEGLELSTMDVVVNGAASDPEVGVTVYRTFQDGTSITRDTIFVQEDGEWKHRFTEEEKGVFMPGTPYEEFVAAQQ